MDEQHHIVRWNLPTPVYEISLGLMMRLMLGYNEYNYISIDDLLGRRELKNKNITSESRYTISINDDKRCIIIQKVPNHGGGRDTAIAYEKGIVKVIAGKDYMHKGKRP